MIKQNSTQVKTLDGVFFRVDIQLYQHEWILEKREIVRWKLMKWISVMFNTLNIVCLPSVLDPTVNGMQRIPRIHTEQWIFYQYLPICGHHLGPVVPRIKCSTSKVITIFVGIATLSRLSMFRSINEPGDSSSKDRGL